MGTVYEANCPECGYQKSFSIGSGLFALQLHRHLRCFDEREQEEIQKLEQENRIQNFQIVNQLSFCKHCGKLREKAVLYVTGTNQEKYVFGSHCADCQGELILYGEQEMGHVLCPDCGKAELKFSGIGRWD